MRKLNPISANVCFTIWARMLETLEVIHAKWDA